MSGTARLAGRPRGRRGGGRRRRAGAVDGADGSLRALAGTRGRPVRLDVRGHAGRPLGRSARAVAPAPAPRRRSRTRPRRPAPRPRAGPDAAERSRRRPRGRPSPTPRLRRPTPDRRRLDCPAHWLDAAAPRLPRPDAARPRGCLGRPRSRRGATAATPAARARASRGRVVRGRARRRAGWTSARGGLRRRRRAPAPCARRLPAAERALGRVPARVLPLAGAPRGRRPRHRARRARPPDRGPRRRPQRARPRRQGAAEAGQLMRRGPVAGGRTAPGGRAAVARCAPLAAAGRRRAGRAAGPRAGRAALPRAARARRPPTVDAAAQRARCARALALVGYAAGSGYADRARAAARGRSRRDEHGHTHHHGLPRPPRRAAPRGARHRARARPRLGRAAPRRRGPARVPAAPRRRGRGLVAAHGRRRLRHGRGRLRRGVRPLPRREPGVPQPRWRPRRPTRAPRCPRARPGAQLVKPRRLWRAAARVRARPIAPSCSSSRRRSGGSATSDAAGDPHAGVGTVDPGRARPRPAAPRRPRRRRAPAPALVAEGRRLFRSTEMAKAGESCQSCHIDGGGTNAELGTIVHPQSARATSRGPRDVPSLWGVADTPPYGWAGQEDDARGVRRRHDRVALRGRRPQPAAKTAGQVAALVAYLRDARAAGQPVRPGHAVGRGAARGGALPGQGRLHRLPRRAAADRQRAAQHARPRRSTRSDTDPGRRAHGPAGGRVQHAAAARRAQHGAVHAQRLAQEPARTWSSSMTSAPPSRRSRLTDDEVADLVAYLEAPLAIAPRNRRSVRRAAALRTSCRFPGMCGKEAPTARAAQRAPAPAPRPPAERRRARRRGRARRGPRVAARPRPPAPRVPGRRRLRRRARRRARCAASPPTRPTSCAPTSTATSSHDAARPGRRPGRGRRRRAPAGGRRAHPARRRRPRRSTLPQPVVDALAARHARGARQRRQARRARRARPCAPTSPRDAVVVRIEDDGAGFDPGKTPFGSGLRHSVPARLAAHRRHRDAALGAGRRHPRHRSPFPSPTRPRRRWSA